MGSSELVWGKHRTYGANRETVFNDVKRKLTEGPGVREISLRE